MVLPSKELLSAVTYSELSDIEMFGKSQIKCHKIVKDVDFGYEVRDAKVREYINIYEIQHLMKEWAVSKGWHLYTCITENEGALCDGAKAHNKQLYYDADTEFEAVIIACEWILKDKHDDTP